MERKGCIEMPSNQYQAQSNISQATRKTLEYIHFDAAAMTLGIHFNVFVHFWIHVRGRRGRGQAWAGRVGASVGGASVGRVGVGEASGSETGGTGMTVEPYKMAPCSWHNILVPAWHVQLARKRQRSNWQVSHGCVHGQRISRVDSIG